MDSSGVTQEMIEFLFPFAAECREGVAELTKDDQTVKQLAAEYRRASDFRKVGWAAEIGLAMAEKGHSDFSRAMPDDAKTFLLSCMALGFAMVMDEIEPSEHPEPKAVTENEGRGEGRGEGQ